MLTEQMEERQFEESAKSNSVLQQHDVETYFGLLSLGMLVLGEPHFFARLDLSTRK